MGSVYHFNVVLFGDKSGKISDSRAGGVSYDHTGCEVDDLSTVLFHLGWCVFNIASRASIAGGISNQFYFFSLVSLKCSFTIPKSPEAFSP